MYIQIIKFDSWVPYVKTSKKPKILIFIGVHPGLKFAPH